MEGCDGFGNEMNYNMSLQMWSKGGGERGSRKREQHAWGRKTGAPMGPREGRGNRATRGSSRDIPGEAVRGAAGGKGAEGPRAEGVVRGGTRSKEEEVCGDGGAYGMSCYVRGGAA